MCCIPIIENGDRIRAHGGVSVQVAKNQPGLLIVYGGSTTRKT
jgi:hypothetical protein